VLEEYRFPAARLQQSCYMHTHTDVRNCSSLYPPASPTSGRRENNDCKSVEFFWHDASIPCNKIGKHFNLINANRTSSGALCPIFPKKLFAKSTFVHSETKLSKCMSRYKLDVVTQLIVDQYATTLALIGTYISVSRTKTHTGRFFGINQE